MRRGRGRRPTNNNSGGPLMTDHYKIHDLDLELELLKRKREMIEQQQQMLANERELNNQQRQYSYNQRSSFSSQGLQFNDNQNFSDYYNAPSFSNHSGSGVLGKRAGDEPEWSAPSKRFSGPQRGGGRKRFNAGFGSDRSKPKPLLDQRVVPPLMQVQSQKPSVEIWAQPPALMAARTSPPRTRVYNPKPQRSNFRSGRVTKNKPTPSSTVPKLVSYPVPVRKAMVKETSDLVKEVPKSSSAVLLADKVPTQQMAGRLELALGAILKEIKAGYSESSMQFHCFQSQYLLRVMKQEIRERLRRVMIGKVVGKMEEIVEQYRKTFPKQTDSEVVQVALDAQKVSKHKKQLGIKIEDADSAEAYYKTNMNRLIVAALDQIFAKVSEIYLGDSTTQESIKEEFKKIVTKQDEDVKQDGGDKDVNQPDKEAKDISAEEPTATEGAKETVAEEKDDGAVEESDVDKELNRRMKRLDAVVISILRRRLPLFLPKCREAIVRTLNLNKMYKTTKEYILTKVEDKLKLDSRVEISNKINATDKSVASAPAKPIAQRVIPYFVKIYGSPTLPNRKAMHNFLKDFKPQSVKKHRTMHLLFVGFDNKEYFEKIVQIKTLKIGNSTITIRAGEGSDVKVALKDPKANESTDDDVQIVEPNTANDDIHIIDDDKIETGSELDTQIDNLLMAIRKDEEESNELEKQDQVDEATNLEDKEVEDTAVTDNGETEAIVEETPIEKVENVAEENGGDVESQGDSATDDVQESDNVEAPENIAKDESKDEPADEPHKEVIKAEVNPGTPTRSSTRIASSIRTRRASKLLK